MYKIGLCQDSNASQSTGVGMSEDYLPTLFDSFSREYNTTIGKVSVTCLGMAIVKNLVDMMDGDICVKSKLGEVLVSLLFLSIE